MTNQKKLGYIENSHTRQLRCMNCGGIFSDANRYRGSMGGDFCSENCYDEYLEDFANND